MTKQLSETAEKIPNRDALGRFVKGVSGNNVGRPKGSKNRTTQIKQAIEEAIVTNHAEDIAEIMANTIKLAKQGEEWAVKLVDGWLQEVRKNSSDDEADRGPRRIEVNITQFNGAADSGTVIDGTARTVEDQQA